MSVLVNTYAPSYYLTPMDNGKKKPISALEITSLKKMNNPKYLGAIVAQDLLDDSLWAELMAKGREFVFATDQVVWEEKAEGFNETVVTGEGAVSFASSTGTFTINAAALPVDPYDINSERPTVPQWLQVKVGLQFVAFDQSGRKANGKIKSIAPDLKTFVADPIGGSWNNLGATSLTIMFTGNNLDHCSLAPCIGFANYMPARENTMFKDSECVTYCEETEIANSYDGEDVQPLVRFGDEEYNVDSRLDDAHRNLTLRNENAFAYEKRLTVAEAGTGQRGTDGVFTILENRATKYLGMIETKEDLMNLAANMRQRKIKVASLRVSNEQYNKLLEILDDTKYSFDPFQDNTNALYYIGFAGFKIGEERIMFKRWGVLDQLPNIGKRYHWLLIPEGTLKVKFNKKIYEAGYLNIGWFGKTGDVYKYKRVEESKKNGDVSIDYINKFMPLVLRPQDFMMGMTIAA
ncbi:hypothetical protein [uncultured Chryseobacterium sp.]|uniref:hypothetical protein n=1 Tax=uncultured Chryseobacterium sp. TaxID=259322 RepID=UPI0025E5EEF8|nr:hypothetical protein [uncultured Chryseobacterium sp.]